MDGEQWGKKEPHRLRDAVKSREETPKLGADRSLRPRVRLCCDAQMSSVLYCNRGNCII